MQLRRHAPARKRHEILRLVTAARSFSARRRAGTRTREPPRLHSCSRVSTTGLKNRKENLAMPDVDDVQDGKNYHLGVPMQANAFFLKGSNSLDWGMKNRLARIFNPATAANRDAGGGPRLLSGTDHRPGAHRRVHRAAGSLRRRADDHARRAAQLDSAGDGRNRSCCAPPAARAF